MGNKVLGVNISVSYFLFSFWPILTSAFTAELVLPVICRTQILHLPPYSREDPNRPPDYQTCIRQSSYLAEDQYLDEPPPYTLTDHNEPPPYVEIFTTSV